MFPVEYYSWTKSSTKSNPNLVESNNLPSFVVRHASAKAVDTRSVALSVTINEGQ